MQILAATQTPGETGQYWFQGTADAVRQFTWLFDVRNYITVEGILQNTSTFLFSPELVCFRFLKIEGQFAVRFV